MLDLPLAVRAQAVLWTEALLLAVVAGLCYAIKRRPRPLRSWHSRGMTAALAAQTLLFLWGMAPVFLRTLPYTVPGLGTLATQVTLVHAVASTVSLALGWWVVLTLQLKLARPRRQTARALRQPMRWAALTWAAAFALGAALYWILYR